MIKYLIKLSGAAGILATAPALAQDRAENSRTGCVAEVGDMVRGSKASPKAATSDAKQIRAEDIRCKIVVNENDVVLKVTPGIAAGKVGSSTRNHQSVTGGDRSIGTPDHWHDEESVQGVENHEQPYLDDSEHERLGPAEDRSISAPDHLYNEAPENQR
jgi:hypothetical protein